MFCVNIKSILETKIFDFSKPSKKEPLQTNFKLPILYLDEKEIHPLSEIVVNDLELYDTDSTNTNTGKTEENKTMYNYLLNPTHPFSKNMVSKWNKQYTTNISFLKDSQTVIKNMNEYKSAIQPYKKEYDIDCDKIMEIWKETKENPLFLEKYNYMEWDCLKELNNSNSFLQTLSVLNMTSPILSFIVPFVILIVPFFILKMKRIPITVADYCHVLKTIAKNHVIGKTLENLQSLSFEKIIYIIVSIGFYFLQIYQNITQCMRFYRNISIINNYLMELKKYLKYSISSMENFCKINAELATYTSFCKCTKKHTETLQSFYDLLEPIQPFTPGFSKLSEIGYLLKCFYQLHSNDEYENSLKYAVGFEGYIDNLSGIRDNIELGHISFTEFSNDKKCEFKEQYYPALMDENPIKNKCDLNKNIIISAPNASGKTTMLKTTMINIIFSQQFGVGFYQSAIINPYTHIHSYLNIPDTSNRDSLFQSEARRCKEIIDIINNTDVKERHFCIFDELYSGTNPHESIKTSYAFLLYLSKYENVDFMMTTHLVSVCKKMKKHPKIKNYKMNVIEKPDGIFEYTYKMKKGISKIQGGILVLKGMNYPDEIIETINKYDKKYTQNI